MYEGKGGEAEREPKREDQLAERWDKTGDRIVFSILMQCRRREAEFSLLGFDGRKE